VGSVAADREAALHSPGLAGDGATLVGGGGGAEVVGSGEDVVGLAAGVAGCVVSWVWAWLGPHPVSSSVTAAAAVVMANPWDKS